MAKKNKGRQLSQKEIKAHSEEKFTRAAIDYRSWVYRALGLTRMPHYFTTLSIGQLADLDAFARSGALAYFEPRGILGKSDMDKAMAEAWGRFGQEEADASVRLVGSESDRFNCLCDVQDPGWFSCLRGQK